MLESLPVLDSSVNFAIYQLLFYKNSFASLKICCTPPIHPSFFCAIPNPDNHLLFDSLYSLIKNAPFINAILPFSLNTTEILCSKFKQAHVHGSGTHMFSIQNNPLCGHLKKKMDSGLAYMKQELENKNFHILEMLRYPELKVKKDIL